VQNVYMDWGQGKKLQIVDGEGEPFPQQANVFAFLETYSPVRIFTETAMSCKHPHERNEIIDYAKSLGSEILCLGTRTTRTYCKQWGISGELPDIVAAGIIRRIALETDALFVPIKKVTIRPPSLQRRADKLGIKGVTAQLGRYADAPENVQRCFGNGEQYDTTAKLFVQAALESDNRLDFIRQVGCYGHGYPNILRATFYRRVKTLALRIAGERSSKVIPTDVWSGLYKSCQKDLFKALKTLYYQVKQQQKRGQISFPKGTRLIPLSAVA
jgi:hypothetical protein